MTNYDSAEIVRSYLQSENKTEQVFILAELTLSDTDTIIEILKDAGVLNDKDLNKRICCKCGREYITSTYRGIPVCDNCQSLTKEISKIEYQIKRNNALISDKLREIGKIAKKNAKLREKIVKVTAEASKENKEKIR